MKLSNKFNEVTIYKNVKTKFSKFKSNLAKGNRNSINSSKIIFKFNKDSISFRVLATVLPVVVLTLLTLTICTY